MSKIKRVCDVVISGITLIVISPILLLIAVLIRVNSKGPVIFKQRRIGKDNKEFTMYKFRTMKIDAPNVATHLLKNPETYLTTVGIFLRRTSLDEIPQLLNILIGDMSIVGPRPALYNQYDLIELRTKYGVHKLVPGLTGWAQINGRDELGIEDKVKYDTEYMNEFGLLFDIKVILKTTTKIIHLNRDKKPKNIDVENEQKISM